MYAATARTHHSAILAQSLSCLAMRSVCVINDLPHAVLDASRGALLAMW